MAVRGERTPAVDRAARSPRNSHILRETSGLAPTPDHPDTPRSGGTVAELEAEDKTTMSRPDQCVNQKLRPP
jgi:hypothetical protein